MARGKTANAPAVLTLLKAAFIGCVVSIALIVIFAALMWKQVVGVELIPIVNAAIKVIGAAAAQLGLFTQCSPMPCFQY